MLAASAGAWRRWSTGRVAESCGGTVSGEVPLAPGELEIGTQMAGYQIEQQIGRGGMAVVYRAFDPRLGRSVALKILAPELARDAAFRERFTREMRAAAAVDHPHIVPVYDAGEANGVLFIAMRFVSGHDLRTLLDHEGKLPAARVAHIIRQVASALDEAHSHGLIHRDVKPGNILIAAVAGSGQPDHVYLSDFGLSKQSISSNSLTATGQFLGTLDYMAPEQVDGRSIDGRADQYALACSAFEMLAGSPPFKRDESVAVLWAQLQAPPPSLRALRPDLPPAVDQVMAKAMAKSPADRYDTCAAFAGALRAACGLRAGEAGASAPPAAPPAWPATEMARVGDQPLPASFPPDRTEPQPAAAAPGPSAPTDPWSAPPTFYPPDPRPAPPVSYPPGLAPTEGPARRVIPPSGASGRYVPPPPPPSRYTAGRAAPERRRSWAAVAIIVGCIVLLGAAGAAFALLRGGGSTSTSSSTPQPSAHATTRPAATTNATAPVNSATTGPAATVQAYVTAINAHRYARAWALGGKNSGSTYSSFVQGFNGTAQDNLTIISVAGSVVTAKLAALQTNGSVKNFEGTYTVSNAVITHFDIRQTS
jgi:serine/threonine protein kinase